MKKELCFLLFNLLLTASAFSQEQASNAQGSSRLSFSTLSPNPFQNQFTFSPEADGKIVIFNQEGQRVEEKYFSNGEQVEMGSNWPKGTYHIKIFGQGRTDFTKVRKD